MTDQSDAPQGNQSEPELHPLYKPATSDSVLTIRFVGNTAVVGRLGFSGAPGVDPYQMLAAAEELKRKAFQMLQAAEVAEAKARQRREGVNQVQTATRIPPGGFKEPGPGG